MMPAKTFTYEEIRSIIRQWADALSQLSPEIAGIAPEKVIVDGEERFRIGIRITSAEIMKDFDDLVATSPDPEFRKFVAETRPNKVFVGRSEAYAVPAP